jgi:hypothetical protein
MSWFFRVFLLKLKETHFHEVANPSLPKLKWRETLFHEVSNSQLHGKQNPQSLKFETSISYKKTHTSSEAKKRGEKLISEMKHKKVKKNSYLKLGTKKWRKTHI